MNARDDLFVGQEHLQRALLEIRRTADRVRSVTVVIALAHKAQVLRCKYKIIDRRIVCISSGILRALTWRHKERLLQSFLRIVEQIRCNVHHSTNRRHRASESQYPAILHCVSRSTNNDFLLVHVECCNFSRVSFEITEIEMIRIGFVLSSEPKMGDCFLLY